jgi:hypothetical protein
MKVEISLTIIADGKPIARQQMQVPEKVARRYVEGEVEEAIEAAADSLLAIASKIPTLKKATANKR